jgi:chitinase
MIANRYGGHGLDLDLHQLQAHNGDEQKILENATNDNSRQTCTKENETNPSNSTSEH